MYKFMKPFIYSFCLILLFTIVCFPQVEDTSKIDAAIAQLENSQKELWQIDVDQMERIANLEKEVENKGEFETTQQFEDRKTKVYDQISQLSLELREQNGIQRFAVQKQINKLLRTEFEGTVQVKIGQYDADKQLFPINLTNNLLSENLFIPLAEAKELKEHISEAKIVSKLGLLLDYDGKAQSFLLSSKINFRGKIYQTISTNLELEKALNMFYGNYSLASKSSSWKLYETEDSETYKLIGVTAKSVLFKPFQENGIQKFLLVTETEKEDGGCHVCGAILGIAVFSKKDDFWKIESAQKNLGEQGRWGKLDEPFLVKVGKEKYALKFFWGDMHQGYENRGDYYFALDNDLFREILSYSTFEDSSASDVKGEDQISVRGKVSFVAGIHPDYYDAKVQITGKKAVKVGRGYMLKPYTKTEIYSYIDNKYQPITK